MGSAGVGTTIGGGPLAVVGPEPATICSVRWSGAGSGVAGAVVELAEVSVVREPGWCVGCSIQFGWFWIVLMRCSVMFQI